MAGGRLEEGEHGDGPGDSGDDAQAVLGQLGRRLDGAPSVGEQAHGHGREPVVGRTGRARRDDGARPLDDGAGVDIVVDGQLNDADAGQVRAEATSEGRGARDRRGLAEGDVGGIDAEADDLEVDAGSGGRFVTDLVDGDELLMRQGRPGQRVADTQADDGGNPLGDEHLVEGVRIRGPAGHDDPVDHRRLRRARDREERHSLWVPKVASHREASNPALGDAGLGADAVNDVLARIEQRQLDVPEVGPCDEPIEGRVGPERPRQGAQHTATDEAGDESDGEHRPPGSPQLAPRERGQRPHRDQAPSTRPATGVAWPFTI